MAVQNQRVFVRADLDGLMEEGRLEIRLKRVVPVIDFLLQKKATIILAGHDAPNIGFRPIADALSKTLARSVAFTEVAQLKETVAHAPPGSIVMLENLLKHDGEAKCDAAFADLLAAVTDIYVSEAFGALTRPYASILKLPKHKPVASGPLLNDTLVCLQQIASGKQKPLTLLLAGNDLSKKAELLSKLLRVSSTALVAGSIAYTFMKSRLVSVGNSIVDVQQEVAAFQLQEKAELEQTEFFLPTDHFIAERFSRDAKPKVVREIPERWMGLDIGPKTISQFEKSIKASSSVICYGTVGAIEIPAFAAGTKALMKALSKTRATIVFIGEDTVRCAEEFSFHNAVFIHQSEPAIAVLSGKQPPGLEILQKEI